ncbi:hypothetical protein Hanom_Chr01g00007331 [Helianthus anomalus]
MADGGKFVTNNEALGEDDYAETSMASVEDRLRKKTLGYSSLECLKMSVTWDLSGFITFSRWIPHCFWRARYVNLELFHIFLATSFSIWP